MKLREIIEAYYNTYKVTKEQEQKQAVEVFVNPSLKELNKIIKESGGYYIRFAIIDKKLYVWNSNFIHFYVLKELNKKVNSPGMLSGTGYKERGKWSFLRSDQIEAEIFSENRGYLKSIVDKDYKWVDKYISFTPKWNEYKKQIEKVI